MPRRVELDVMLDAPHARSDQPATRHAAPGTAVPGSDYPDALEAGFRRDLDSYAELSARLWQQAPATQADLGPARSWWRRWQCGRALGRRIQELEARLADHAPSEESRVDAELPKLGGAMLDLLAIDGVGTGLLMRPDMTGATEDFVRRARRDHPELAAEDLGQALRNFWVVNFFQLLHLGAPRCSDSSLGYSLLYPYTDNVLDDEQLSGEDKRQRSRSLGLRLSGVQLPPSCPGEARVFQQIERLETDFPRSEFPQVFLALQAIHRHQVESLRQQGEEHLDDDELLRLSVGKGGASVLVDAYLVDGRPPQDLARFAFVYGVALQLADDLQDVECDLSAGHQTLFTRAALRGNLGATFWKLVHFLDASLGLCPQRVVEGVDLRGLSRASLVHLMIQAIGAQRIFDAGLRRRVGRRSPVTFRRARAVRGRLARCLTVSF